MDEVRSAPLSVPQRRRWLLEQRQPGHPVHTIAIGHRIVGPLDVAALGRALTGLVARHEILRTAYHVVDGEPRQTVLPPRPLALRTAATEPTGGTVEPPFDLAAGEVLRATLVRHGPADHRLLLALHRIAGDAGTVGLLCRDLSALYQGVRLDPLPAHYVEFAGRPAGEPSRRHWRNRVAGDHRAALPTDLPRPVTRPLRGGAVTAPLPTERVAALTEFARNAGSTLATALLATFGVLLARWSGRDDVLVGVPTDLRDRPEHTGLAGLFATTLAVRVDLAGRPSFAALLDRVATEQRAAAALPDPPPDRLGEEPPFEVLFGLAEQAELVLPGCTVTTEHQDTGTADADLALWLTSAGDTLSARLSYASDLYRPDTAERMLAQFRTLLDSVTADPSVPVGELAVLPPAELAQLAAWSTGPALSTANQPSLPELVAARAAESPTEVALVAGTRQLTRAELLTAADVVADRLRAHGVGAGVPVGVHLDRTPELLVALLAVLRAGGACLPLDPALPTDRLSSLVTAAGCPLLLTRRALARRAAALPVPDLLVDDPVDLGQPPRLLPTPDLDDLAYLTRPPAGGVRLTHRDLVAFGLALDRLLGRAPGVWLALTGIDAPASVLELLWTIARGHRVVLDADRPPPGAMPHVPDLSLFFSGAVTACAGPRYQLLLTAARFADRSALAAVWTPERHFDSGDSYPNPSVTGAAIAAVTERVAVRAGSVSLPLHDPVRVAEEWSVVDHLSGGRAGIAFAPGWRARDFALAPDRYADRQRAMATAIEQVRALWRGEPMRRRVGTGAEVELRVFPRPVRDTVPIWLTAAGSPEIFRLAGAVGAGVLTRPLGPDLDQLAERIALYRRSWRGVGSPQVTVVLPTFLGESRDRVRELVVGPLSAYLRNWIDLGEVDRLFDQAALLGTPEDAVAVMDRLARIGVDEIACLIDFGVDEDVVTDSLPLIAELRDLAVERHRAVVEQESVGALIRRHGVTHVLCAPSTAHAIVDDPDAPRLRGLLVGGEPVPSELVDRLAGRADQAYAWYGSAGPAVFAVAAPLADAPASRGRPLAGTQVSVVDRDGQLVPIGAVGELVVGGPAGHRTGELVRWRPDGTLDQLGRLPGEPAPSAAPAAAWSTRPERFSTPSPAPTSTGVVELAAWRRGRRGRQAEEARD